MERDEAPPSPVKPLLSYALFGTPVAILVFLLFSGFFSAWSGTLAGVRQVPTGTEPTALRVMIVDADGDHHERAWPAELVRGLALPVSSSGFPPLKLPEDAPTTTKARFSLSFLVTKPGQKPTVVQSITPTALGMALLSWFIGLLLRNAYVSGNPLNFHPDVRRLEQLAAAGQVAPVDDVPSKRRGQQGPPPSKHGRKKKNRR